MGANKKISDLTAGSSIGGTEELPIVQSGSTVKTTISAIKTFLESVFVKKGTITNNTILKGSSTDTATNSQITDDGTTVKINNKTEITDNDLTLYNTSHINAHLDTSDTYGGSLRIYDDLGNLVANITGKDFATYFNTNYSFGIGTATPKGNTKLHVKTNTNQNLLVYEYAGKLTVQAENDAGSAYSSLQFYCDFELPLLNASQIVGTDANKKLVSIPFGTTAGTVLEGNAITQTITNGVIDKSPSEDAVFDGLTLKVDKNTSITGATKTKITYDSKGLVTSGADATTADIADSLNKRYVTDANLTVIGNTSGTNTGDETQSSIQTKLGLASTSTSGYLSSTDWNTFNGKQNALGFTPENVANKSDSYTVSSTTTYASTKALVDGLASIGGGGSADEELFYISAFKSLYNY